MNFFNFCKGELGTVLAEAGFERFRAAQLFKKVYQKKFCNDFLPQKLQAYLKDNFTFETHTTTLSRNESADGTIKSLLSVGCQVVECKAKFILDFISNSFFFSCSHSSAGTKNTVRVKSSWMLLVLQVLSHGNSETGKKFANLRNCRPVFASCTATNKYRLHGPR